MAAADTSPVADSVATDRAAVPSLPVLDEMKSAVPPEVVTDTTDVCPWVMIFTASLSAVMVGF